MHSLICNENLKKKKRNALYIMLQEIIYLVWRWCKVEWIRSLVAAANKCPET